MNSVVTPAGVRAGDDRRQAAAVGLAQVPDPHPLAVERGSAHGARAPGRGGRSFPRRRRVQRVVEDVDRTEGTRVAGARDQHHDAARMRAARDRDDQAERRLAQARARRVAADAGAVCSREHDDHARSEAGTLQLQGPVGRDLMRVRVAPFGGHAADARDPHRLRVRRSGCRAPFTAGVLDGAEPPDAPLAGVPPALAAVARCAARPKRHALSAANIAARRLDRFCARVLANVLLRA